MSQLAALERLIKSHVRRTGSLRGTALLERWDDEAVNFRRIAPTTEILESERNRELATGTD